MADIKVRVGQQNAVKVVASVSGSAGGRAETAVTAENVIGGIASVTQLNVSGISTFVGVATFINDVYIGGDLYVQDDLRFDEFTSNNAYITGFLVVDQAIFYDQGQPYGIAYFNQNNQLVSTGSTSNSIDYTNYIMATDNSGVPVWSNSIDGGIY
jgi:hypothetical protein